MRRFHCGTADWHVFARGSRRLALFRDDQDFRQFLTFLAYGLRVSGCILWGFALMTNHYHLVLRGGSAQLTACMKRENRLYSRYHNKRYGLSGHAFDGPYQAFRQATRLLTLQCLAYVFMNPVKGGLCTRPEDYRWSGYRSYCSKPGNPLPIKPGALMKAIHPDQRVGWSRFREAMNWEARREPKPQFGKLTMLEVHLQQFEWLLDHARQQAAALIGEDPTVVAMFWAKQCGISPRTMAKALGVSTSTALRQSLHRFSVRVAHDPGLNSLLVPP